jgi:hypothetical protein
MDQHFIDAYIQMARTQGVSADEIVLHPDHRARFLTLVRPVCDWPEADIFRRLMNLRRTSRLPTRRELLTTK